MKFFHIKTIWYLIAGLVIITIIMDLNMHPDAWFPMAMFTIPYCLGLAFIGFVYHLYFKNEEIFPKVLTWLVKTFFCILVVSTLLQIIGAPLSKFTNFNINLRLSYFGINFISLLKYSQIPILFLIPVFVFQKVLK